MFSALGTNFCGPEGPHAGSRGGCVRVPAWLHEAVRQAHARTGRGTSHGGLRVHKSGSQGLKHGIPYVEGAESVSGLGLPQFQGFGDVQG